MVGPPPYLRTAWVAGLQVIFWASAVLLPCAVSSANDSALAIDQRMHHLRIDGPPEWSDFPEKAEARGLKLKFRTARNDAPQTLRLRQQDVKQPWHVLLNDNQLGQLPVDENEMVVYFAIPAGVLVNGEDSLRIEQDVRRRAVPDDIRVGGVAVDSRAMT